MIKVLDRELDVPKPRQFEVIIKKVSIDHTKITHSFLMAKEESPKHTISLSPKCTKIGVITG